MEVNSRIASEASAPSQTPAASRCTTSPARWTAPAGPSSALPWPVQAKLASAAPPRRLVTPQSPEDGRPTSTTASATRARAIRPAITGPKSAPVTTLSQALGLNASAGAPVMVAVCAASPATAPASKSALAIPSSGRGHASPAAAAFPRLGRP